MKRITKLTVLLICLISGINISYAVEGDVINGIRYQRSANHAEVVFEYGSGYKGHITIPDVVSYEWSVDSELKTVTVPVTEIQWNAFFEDKELTGVTIGGNVEEIGGDAFAQSGIRSIVIPDNVKEIDGGAFRNCNYLTSVHLGRGIETIANGTFSECDQLESIEIPSNVKTIGTHAFSECTNLKNIILNEGLQLINDFAFDKCTSLTQIEVPNSVELIKYFCTGCTNLKIAYLGKGIKKIWWSAFKNCPNLQYIVCRSTTPPELDYSTFDDRTLRDVILFVPVGSGNKYRSHSQWKKFKNIREGEPKIEY